MPTVPPCRLLEWDSQFFGRRIARVCTTRLGREDARRVRDWARSEAVDCLYYLACASDAESIRVAEDEGFRLADVRLTRERELSAGRGGLPEAVEPFREEDLPALRAIARVSHRDSRFYFDPHFPRERCDALYETWIEKSCTGLADAVLVVRHDGAAAGYATCERDRDGAGTIGLFAVAPDRRGGGLGERLLRGALAWFAGHACRSVRVVSQARNVASSRLYEKQGFRTLSVQHYYHLWLSSSRPGRAS